MWPAITEARHALNCNVRAQPDFLQPWYVPLSDSGSTINGRPFRDSRNIPYYLLHFVSYIMGMKQFFGKVFSVLLTIAEAAIAAFFAGNLIFVGILGWDGSFDAPLFWRSPLVWTVLVLFPLTFLIQKKTRLVRKEDLPGLFRGSLRFLFFLFRSALYTLWRTLIVGSGRPDWRDASEGLVFFAFLIGLWALLSWLGYGRTMRSRVNRTFFDDLATFAKERNGRAVTEDGGITDFLLNAQSIDHTIVMGDPMGSQEESLFQVVVWPEPPQGIAVHWLRVTRRNPITRYWSIRIRWTLCMMGKLGPEFRRTDEDSTVLNPREMAARFSSTEERNRWTALCREWRIKNVEILRDDYLITWKPAYDWNILSIRPPSGERLSEFCREIDRLLNVS